MLAWAQTACYAALVFLTIASNVVLLPVNFQLIVSATSIVYIGSTLSLKLKQHRDATGEKNEEAMTKEDAYMFPIIGSGMLFGLYLLFKFFDKDIVNLLLTAYFALIGTYSLTEAFSPVVRAIAFSDNERHFKRSFELPYFGKQTIDLTPSWCTTGVFAAGFAAAWFQTKHFVLNNIFGISLSIKGIESLSLGSYKVGAILLCGLFFYDIFWVFGTDVMVTVATKFDGPIKLLFPRAFATATEKAKFSILGLGDIVIPGIFVALLLRFDAHRAKATTITEPFPRPYFHINILFYVLGLVATVVVMLVFNAAQPALLYLVPACLGSSLVTAIVRGELKELLAYSEEDEDDKEKKGVDDKKKTEEPKKDK
ncbi:aspartyl protease family A22B [Thraustotheca clavata]|uniref:Aspartyl protease family A22B n=1 Tax=Thraustotheca clavata TaxID=74557 RepID=A0A1W0A2D6_9STRA|nr:aspartyl protease family A22B [Thraustotheca clavata]